MQTQTHTSALSLDIICSLIITESNRKISNLVVPCAPSAQELRVHPLSCCTSLCARCLLESSEPAAVLGVRLTDLCKKVIHRLQIYCQF